MISYLNMEKSETKTLTINPWFLLLGASFIASLFGIIFLITLFFIVRAWVIYEFGLNSFTYYLS
tara:strand:- start:327 stop:518 length:192 start_codon:yes stop_codon:yes gene_type:complete